MPSKVKTLQTFFVYHSNQLGTSTDNHIWTNLGTQVKTEVYLYPGHLGTLFTSPSTPSFNPYPTSKSCLAHITLLYPNLIILIIMCRYLMRVTHEDQKHSTLFHTYLPSYETWMLHNNINNTKIIKKTYKKNVGVSTTPIKSIWPIELN